MSQRQWKRGRQAKGYSWLFFRAEHSWWIGLLVTVLVIGAGISFYVWYSRFGDDIAPDSIAGFIYAITGTTCFVLAAVLYVVRRRSPRRAIGQLHASLNWHVFLAVMGIALLLMHSFGNFNAKTGTYALYSLIVLVVSGFVGRAIDRIVPRLIAGEVDIVLTGEGEDRAEVISRDLEAIVEPSAAFSLAQKQASASLPHFLGTDDQAISTPWDMAYISFEAASPLVERRQGRGNVLDRRSDIPLHPGLFMYHARQQAEEIQCVQQAIQREQFYRCIIRYWRLFHIALALLTIGLIIWHLIFVAQLLVPAFIR